MKQMPKSRLKQLLERPLGLKYIYIGDKSFSKGDAKEFEPTSLCLGKLVQNYMEDPDSGKQRCGGPDSCDTCFDEEFYSTRRILRRLKNLLLCTHIPEGERDLMIKTREIVEKENNEDSQMRVVLDELVALGYNAAICKYRWKRSRKLMCPGEYDYLDVIVGKKRVVIDFDFKSKFKIAPPTDTYKSLLETLPNVYVGRVGRLKKIVDVLAKAAKTSFEKNEREVPPWRRADHVFPRWLVPYVRTKPSQRKTNEITKK
ncbi:unnamed protein product [Thlaspi arvense]|uniref:Uncharacterized protein n=1 Tax=Thlaspi arvense TaxID=13288 RepID=A0AAU9SFL3_THLAR|nr:unnamed protein product [Thlaspi arvense]